MLKRLVLTVTGRDRVGIVDDVTKVVLSYQGNVESSRMARLGGEFAMLMLISAPEAQFDSLQDGLRALKEQGFDLVSRPTEHNVSQKFAGWSTYQLQVRGADHEGIIHQITHHLAQEGVSIETMDTGTEDAPFGGTVLFSMTATVVAPPESSFASLQEALADIGHELQVDTEIARVSG